MPKPHKASRLVLRIYVAGNGPNSLRALVNVRAICEEHFADHYELEVVDMLKQPDRALADGVIVTPTLLKLLPLPAMKLIGSLSDSDQVRLALAAE